MKLKTIKVITIRVTIIRVGDLAGVTATLVLEVEDEVMQEGEGGGMGDSPQCHMETVQDHVTSNLCSLQFCKPLPPILKQYGQNVTLKQLSQCIKQHTLPSHRD